MRIESIDIRGFGCLVDRVFDLPRDRAVLVIADNEHGKSTLAAAITAGICGLPRGTRAAKPRDVCCPWAGGDYALTLRLESQGRGLVVERDFARDRFTVRDAATNRDVSSEFDEDMAASILRLPREDFARIALILGKEVHRFDSSVGLKSRLTELVEGSRDADAEAAIAAIEDARYMLGGKSIKIETAVKRLSESRDRALREMSRLDEQIDAAEQETRELGELQRRHEELTDRIARLDAEYREACLAEVRERLQSAREHAEAIEKLRGELTQLASYESFPAGRADQLTTAATRRDGLQSRLGEIEKRMGASRDEAARLKSALDQETRFASATDQDVARLGGCVDAMEDAAKKTEQIRAEYAAMKRFGSSRLWGAVGAAGCLGAVVCIALMILQLLSPAASAVGAVLSGIAAAAGLTFLARGGRQGAELRAKLEQTQEFHDSAAGRTKDQLSFLGVCCDGGDVAEIARRSKDALAKYLADRKRLADLQADIASMERDMADLRRKIGDEDDLLHAIFDESGIDCALPLNEARKQFDEGLRHCRRYREIRDSLLPALEARSVSAEEIATLEAREAELAHDAGEDMAQRASAEVESERQAARGELDRTTARLRELEGRIGTLVDNYRRQYPILQERAEGLGAELAKVSRFGQALEAAGRTLREVAQSTRRRWATALNDRAAAILPHLNPDYDTLLFDDNLDFTIRRVSDGRVLDKAVVDSALSTGAKDQVYLAARLACAAEISCAEPIPIILDDPFIAFDDSRFESALRYVVGEVARSQQVVMLSCHESRHESVMGEGWFRDRVELIRI